jgi:pimeloyl-ACP methyl ester carboxylesterase
LESAKKSGVGISQAEVSLRSYSSSDSSCELYYAAHAPWSPTPDPRLFDALHGMGEQIGRYTDLIEVLVASGMVVYGNDHRGHGHTAASPSHFGDFGEGGFNLLVEDMVRLSQVARNENPEKPFILLGHSMGSFAAQQYVLDHGGLMDGLVLSGSGALDRLERAASSVATGENILNARFAPPRTPFDWLSRDLAVADAFMKDPLCFPMLQPASMESFLAASSQLADLTVCAEFDPTYPSTCFQAVKIRLASNSRGLVLSWIVTEKRVSLLSRIIFIPEVDMKCSTRPTAMKSEQTYCSGYRKFCTGDLPAHVATCMTSFPFARPVAAYCKASMA